jgi:hypothetical protein
MRAKINNLNQINSKIELFVPKIDSTLLSIPLQKCEITDTNLIDIITTIKVNNNTGETISDNRKQGEPYIKHYNGISFKIWIKYQFDYINGNKYPVPYIHFLANSKQLEGAYFNGITKNTYQDYYHKIMALNVFKCDYEAFKDARYSDIDICFDFKATSKEFAVLKENIKRSAYDSRLIHTIDTINNSGIWTPSQRDPRKQATPSKPYIKFYSKEKDFTYHSKQFADNYFVPEDYKDIVRFEATIINAKHKTRLGIQSGTTFFQFLNLDLQLFCRIMFNEYIKKPKLVKAIGLKPLEMIIVNAINKIIDQGGDKNDIYEIFDLSGQITNRSTISRSLQKYHKIINNEQINREKLEANSVTKNVFDFLGINRGE